MSLGISGRLTRATIQSPLTPLMLLAAILVGLLAILTIPREEEPQISVPMVDLMVAAPGLSASDAIELVGKPLETIVKSVDGVEHVYTQAEDDGVMVTARFLVGSDPDDAATRINERLSANMYRIPAGIEPPQVTVRGISDVPVVNRAFSQFVLGSDQRVFGKLEFLGGVSYASGTGLIGAISAIRFREDGAHFVAVLDTGHWLTGRIERDAEGQLSGIADVRKRAMIDRDDPDKVLEAIFGTSKKPRE